MLTRLLILWLLSEQPHHGYRIKRILDDPGLRFWFPVEYGSVYGVLRTLVREGHVRPVAVEREGQRPERTRYAISRRGRRHFHDLLEAAWLRLPSPAEPIHLALAARPELGDEEIPLLIRQRLEALRSRLEQLRGLARSAPAGEMVRRQEALTRAELVWAEELLGAREGPARRGRGEEAPMETRRHPTDVQLIANLVVQRPDGKVLLVRYQQDDERWWLPGEDLDPYEHPDEAARRVLGAFPGLLAEPPAMANVDSFRGRRGWHVVFHYRVPARGTPRGRFVTGWFAPDELPRTMHGPWEKEAVSKVLGSRPTSGAR